MKVTVFVSPKATVLDPQGAAVEQAIKSLGHQSVGGVRVGKTITFEMEGEDSPETRTQIDRLCDGLLSNPVIEDYRFEIEAGWESFDIWTKPGPWALVGLMSRGKCF
mgnify:CR=1 FL=1